MSKISISNIAWNPELDELVASKLSSLGINLIDVAPGKYFSNFSQTSDDQVRQLKQKWNDRGFSIIGMQSLLFGTRGLNLFAEASVQKMMLSYLSHVCRIGAGLGATKLVFGSPKNRDRTGLDDQETLEKGFAFFYQLGEIAKSYKVVICLEPNPECYGANFLTKTSDTYTFVSMLNHNHVKMQLDTGAIFTNQEPLEIIKKVKDQIGHIHISEPNLSVLGTENVEHQKLGKLLGYCCIDNPRTIEMLNKNNGNAITDIESAVRLAELYYQ